MRSFGGTCSHLVKRSKIIVFLFRKAYFSNFTKRPEDDKEDINDINVDIIENLMAVIKFTQTRVQFVRYNCILPFMVNFNECTSL